MIPASGAGGGIGQKSNEITAPMTAGPLSFEYGLIADVPSLVVAVAWLGREKLQRATAENVNLFTKN